MSVILKVLSSNSIDHRLALAIGAPDLGKIMNVLEQGLLSGVAMEDVEQNPMFTHMNGGGENQKKVIARHQLSIFFLYWYNQGSRRWKIDPIIGREKEIDRLISILNRKKK